MYELANIDAEPNKRRATGAIFNLTISGLVAANNAIAPAGLACESQGNIETAMETWTLA